MSPYGVPSSGDRGERLESLSEQVAVESVLSARIDGAVATAMERQIRWMITINTGLVALALTAVRFLF